MNITSEETSPFPRLFFLLMWTGDTVERDISSIEGFLMHT
ncbi:hypothetical protein SAMN04487944_10956 [Gracilibacillus ureilyticus]|uniref:Uncharacterized protein n=1 Tax=Gracilibacillus ureilyticus TaxID=531814 RepID=A0A1H9RM02_9BACI|nr:hypothetical protein SAMN04487944_10956 [Gracilibacillus ureilyticus]